MKDSDDKVLTPFISPAKLRAKQAKAKPSSNDIHVGSNTQLSGGFSTNGMMIVDGRVTSVDVAVERLVFSHIGELEGSVTVQRAEMSGTFNGMLKAANEVIIRPTPRIFGSVRGQKLVIPRGAHIEYTFSCSPDAGTEVISEGASPPARSGTSWMEFRRMQRDRRVFLMGAGRVLALKGAGAMLMGFRALLV
ncbi:MAG: polymer-forming cytoskeletal protein [Hydrogenophaga sp.]|uniref:bactofilin family protein n=1 Tax=Hydrogenophaga sp. TaxID=1904254 RepID=UPI002AB8DE7F|nr:polymer-forming cytoskeletal protein [Hydrogenophaga sp.]MDZ4101022.1 polymer-forming cytoskeletal protein [Hydrogenophaga sp.]